MSIVFTAHWSKYATLNALKLASGQGGVIPTGLTVRLYEDNADPDSGPTPVELSVAGYAPIAAPVLDVDPLANTLKNHEMLKWLDMSSAVIGGIAFTDDGTSDVLWYCSFTPITTYPGGGLVVLPNQFIVTTVGV